MVSLTISVSLDTLGLIQNYAELEDIKVSTAAAKLIKKGFAHEAQIRAEKKL